MLVINSGRDLERALAQSFDLGLRRLLLLRLEQLGGDLAGVRLAVIQPGDRPGWVREALGFDLLANPADGTRYGDPEYSPGFDLIEDHGRAYELAFERADHTDVVLVPRAPGVHPDFLDFCAEYASQDA